MLGCILGLLLHMPYANDFLIIRQCAAFDLQGPLFPFEELLYAGVEGVMRICCEKTLGVLRQNKESLLTIIEV